MSSWTEDLDGDLVNLEKMENVRKVELVDATEGEPFAVIASAPSIGAAGEQYWLCIGSEEKCQQHLTSLKEKVLK